MTASILSLVLRLSILFHFVLFKMASAFTIPSRCLSAPPMLSRIRHNSSRLPFVQHQFRPADINQRAKYYVRHLCMSIPPHNTLVQKDKSDIPCYYEAEQTIKRSRFIGIAQYCKSWDEAQSFIKQIRVEHPKARHACYAFVAGFNPVQERCSDDGEPTGTAGLPILGELLLAILQYVVQ